MAYPRCEKALFMGNDLLNGGMLGEFHFELMCVTGKDTKCVWLQNEENFSHLLISEITNGTHSIRHSSASAAHLHGCIKIPENRHFQENPVILTFLNCS